MCLAMVGLAVVPTVVCEQDAALIVAAYLGSKYSDAGETSAGLLLGGASAIWLGLKLAEYAGAYAFAFAAGSMAFGVGLAV